MPKTIMVRYRTTPAHAEANVALVHAVYDALRAKAPGGFHYATYRLADGATFVHLATHELAGDSPLTALPEFQAFQSKLRENCVEPPVLAELTPVDSYR
jgi:quinol monooxygenase YgiN